MEKTSIIKLNIHGPLVYNKIDNLLPVLTENDEFLLCFDLDPVQSHNIEPRPELLLGSHVFSGKKGGLDASQAQKVILPTGMYLFVQCRNPDSVFNREKWFNMAIEQQKDGLWEGYKPASRLYVRFLYEDGAFVTQVLRPILC